jgi:hypothetical protein
MARKVLIIYGALMLLALGLTYLVSLGDTRTLREVGIWVKPMKFMAATVLFAWTTVWLAQLCAPPVSQSQPFAWIAALLILTSLFEVTYITYQAALGAGSHYNNSDPLHAFMFGLMGLAAVGLTATQGWLAWVIWKTHGPQPMSLLTLGVVTGLVMTFLLATFSGFLLGGHQPPAGVGLPWLGWHGQHDQRPAHFLGVHAQQIIPMGAWTAQRFCGRFALNAFVTGVILYVLAWATLTGMST